MPRKESYDSLLQMEERIQEKLKNRIKVTGKLKSGAPIEQDRDVAETTALKEQLADIRARKEARREQMDSIERAATDLYEEAVSPKKKK